MLGHLTRFDVRGLTASPPTLEELFLRHYGADDGPAEVDAAR